LNRFNAIAGKSERHPEDHRVRVDEEHPEQDLLLTREAEALGDGLPAGALGVMGRPERREQPDRPQRGGERRCVEQIRAGQAERGDEEAAERRPRDTRRAPVDVLDRVCGRELVALDQAGDDRVHPRDAEGVEGHREGDEDVDRPDVRVFERGVQREAEGDQRQEHLGHEQHPAAVDCVRDRAADDREGQERDELADREKPDLERRVGDRVKLIRRGNRRDLAAEGRDGLADEEPAESRVAPKRADVDGQAAEQARLADLRWFQGS